MNTFSSSEMCNVVPIRHGMPRALDALLAGAGIVLLLPLFVLVGAAVLVSSRGPILFRQERVGRDGLRFTVLKFRTMRVATRGIQVTAKGDRRVTPIGRRLRQLKLDEIPELWNVLRGDMSLVGPRPEVPNYVDLNNVSWREVLQARPGITDPVTLRLRNEEELMAGISGDRERFYLETLQPYKLARYKEYLQRRSLGSDIGVILRTLLVVVIPAAAPPPSLAELRDESATRDTSSQG